jgi:hypothetical protein
MHTLNDAVVVLSGAQQQPVQTSLELKAEVIAPLKGAAPT